LRCVLRCVLQYMLQYVLRCRLQCVAVCRHPLRDESVCHSACDNVCSSACCSVCCSVRCSERVSFQKQASIFWHTILAYSVSAIFHRNIAMDGTQFFSLCLRFPSPPLPLPPPPLFLSFPNPSCRLAAWEIHVWEREIVCVNEGEDDIVRALRGHMARVW